jgi:hypothetical protein
MIRWFCLDHDEQTPRAKRYPWDASRIRRCPVCGWNMQPVRA